MTVTGCWEEQQRVDDLFTDAEWAYLQTFRIDHLPSVTCRDARCEAIARFGQRLFFDPRLSGPITVASELGAKDEVGKVACTHCHDPAHYFADPAQAQSLGTNWTKRNVPGLVDVAYRRSFIWSGKYASVEGVLDLALTSPAAMNQTKQAFGELVPALYGEQYASLFPGATTWQQAYENGAHAIGAYEAQLVSGPSPFDRYLAGEWTAIDDAAKRGAKLFIGEALCSECHDGPLFADDKFHVTGVAQRGEHAPAVDRGRYDVTQALADDGRFRTPTLRHIAKTGPYMHAGQLETLADVIDLYRWGGDAAGYSGVKDPRIVPLAITDDDARDLEAFLLTLTGAPVDPTWTVLP